MPCVCTQTDAEGKQRKARVRNILNSLKKNTIYNEHPVPASEVWTLTDREEGRGAKASQTGPPNRDSEQS